MSKELRTLLSLKNQEGELSPDDCQKLNEYLANININTLPPDQYENIKEYIDSSLMLGSVDPRYLDAIKTLYDQICDVQQE